MLEVLLVHDPEHVVQQGLVIGGEVIEGAHAGGVIGIGDPGAEIQDQVGVPTEAYVDAVGYAGFHAADGLQVLGLVLAEHMHIGQEGEEFQIHLEAGGVQIVGQADGAVF